MKNKLWAILVLAMILCVAVCCAMAQEAVNITDQCTLYSDGRKMGSLTDGKYTSYWNSNEKKNPSIEFTVPQELEAGYLYICFGEMPSKWAIEEKVGGEWKISKIGYKRIYEENWRRIKDGKYFVTENMFVEGKHKGMISIDGSTEVKK